MMGDSNRARINNSFCQIYQVDVDTKWRNATIRDLQPRLDWFVDPTQLMDDPLETITINHPMKSFLETKKDRMKWKDTNCIQGLTIPTVNPFTDNRFRLK